MTDPDPSGSPLVTAAETAGPHATEVFGLLSNETRLAILLALWEAHEPFGDDTAATFSDLRDRVGMRDSGQFNYHLGKMEGHFVQQTDGGYRLTQAGRNIVQTVIAGTATHAPSLEPEEVAEPCPRCGAPVAVTYENEMTRVTCTECAGWWEGHPEEGTLVAFGFPPAGLGDRPPEAVLRATLVYQLNRVDAMMDGVCPTCGGHVETWLDVCDDHDATDGRCDACGTPFLGLVYCRCRTCKNAVRAPSWGAVVTHPAVVAFYYDHGIEHDHGTWAGVNRGYTCREELQSTDPVRLRITAFADDDELHVTLDGEVAVVSVSE